MSFSRAPVKRFNENVGCAPAPGAYDVKDDQGHKGPASFQKSERFKNAKPSCASLMPPPSPNRSIAMSPVRRAMSVDVLVEGSNVKPGIFMEVKQQKLLEKEIRSLVQQRGEQDKRVLALEEDLRRLEAKLLSAVREKTGLSAGATTLERQLVELKKANEFLKNKVSGDTTKKRINSLTMELMDARNNVDFKNKEISVLQVNTASHVKELETHLHAAKATIKTLTDRNKDLEDLQCEIKAQNDQLLTETKKLHAVIHELKEEIKVLQGYLDTADDQVQDLRLAIREQTELDHTVSESQRVTAGQLQMDLQLSQDALRQQQEDSERYQVELGVSLRSLRDTEQMLASRESELSVSGAQLTDIGRQVERADHEAEECRAVVQQQETELARLRDVLRSTEQELDERVAHMAGRCLSYEEDIGKMQEEGMRKVEELKAELTSLKEVKREEKRKGIQLQQAQAALVEKLEKEKGLVEALSLLLEDSEGQQAHMKEEMEGVLGELAVMEELERLRQDEMDQSLHRLQQGNQILAQQLSHASASLERKSTESALLEESHSTAMAGLREEQTGSLSHLGHITAELGSTKQALKGAEDRVRELEAEEERVAGHLKEELERVIGQKEEEMANVTWSLEEQRERFLAAQQAEETAREEHARVLSEVKTHLAEKDEKILALEGSHAVLLGQLKAEVLVQRREKEQALVQLEERGGLMSSQLQQQKDEAQTLQTKTREERDEAVEELERAREENRSVQTALRELQESMAVESNNGLRSRSALLELQTRLEKLEEERSGLRSQVESLEVDASALRDKLSSAEWDGEKLRVRLEKSQRESLSLQSDVEEEKVALRKELEVERQRGRTLQEQVETLAQGKVTLQWEMAEQNRELQSQLAEAQEESSSSSEAERWKKQYEELYFKVKPFQEQLNSFAAERDALLNVNGVNQEELNRLADAYARLLGHQNQKQKIKHVIKLKDDNVTLKQEVSKLRCQVSRQKSDLDHLRSTQPGAQRRRFDPSKAFQHDDSKENRQPVGVDAAAPAGLREGNCRKL